MHGSTAPALPDVPLARPGPITDAILGQLITEARAAQISADYDITGLHVRMILLPCLEELMARRGAMAGAADPDANVIALTRADTPGPNTPGPNTPGDGGAA